MQTAPLRAVFYLRLSDSDDASTSIVRQEQDLRELAARERWTIQTVLVDDGISGGKTRDKAMEALRMLRDDEADVLATWKLDRFGRRGVRDVADVADAIDAREGTARPALFVAHMDGIRSDFAMWETIAALYAGQAKQERLNTATRVRNSRAHLSRIGRYAGGVVPFGYRTAPAPDGPGRVLIPWTHERELILDVAERIIRGESPYAIARDLNVRGIPTTRSKARAALMAGTDPGDLDRGSWNVNGVQTVWTSDTLLGRVTRGGQPVTDADGMPVQQWEPVLDAGTLASIRARTRNPRRPSSAPATRRTRRARLLSGLAYCDTCNGRMVVSTGAQGLAIYTCPNGSEVCSPRPAMRADYAEQAATDKMLATFGHLEVVERVTLSSADHIDGELGDIEAAITLAASGLTSDDADVPAILARIDALKARRAIVQATPTEQRVELRPTGKTYAETWASADLAAQQRLLADTVSHVVILPMPASGRRGGPRPERVDVYGPDGVVLAG